MTTIRCRPDQHFCLFGPRFDAALEILGVSAHVVICQLRLYYDQK